MSTYWIFLIVFIKILLATLTISVKETFEVHLFRLREFSQPTSCFISTLMWKIKETIVDYFLLISKSYQIKNPEENLTYKELRIRMRKNNSLTGLLSAK